VAEAPQQREPLLAPELLVQFRAPEQFRAPVLPLAVLREHRRQAASLALLPQEARQAA
jgi:hypothetical protein